MPNMSGRCALGPMAAKGGTPNRCGPERLYSGWEGFDEVSKWRTLKWQMAYPEIHWARLPDLRRPM